MSKLLQRINELLEAEMIRDPNFAQGWKESLQLSFYQAFPDAPDVEIDGRMEIAERGAKNFMRDTFGIEVD